MWLAFSLVGRGLIPAVICFIPSVSKADSSPYNKGSLFVYNQPPLCKG